jgi:hypothetical protein
LRQWSGNWAKIQSDSISHVTPIPDSDKAMIMIRVILCPVQTSVAFAFISA